MSLLDNQAIRDSVMPISVEQYHRLGAAGAISERTELLRGVIFKKVNKSPLHVWTVRRLRALIEGQIPPGYYLRQEEPLSFSQSEPEPDLAIVEGATTDHRDAHPTTAILVVEVAITSIEIDREKAGVYAEAGVPEFWLVVPEQQTVVKHSLSDGGCFRRCEAFTFDQQLCAGSIAGLAVDLNELN